MSFYSAHSYPSQARIISRSSWTFLFPIVFSSLTHFPVRVLAAPVDPNPEQRTPSPSPPATTNKSLLFLPSTSTDEDSFPSPIRGHSRCSTTTDTTVNESCYGDSTQAPSVWSAPSEWSGFTTPACTPVPSPALEPQAMFLTNPISFGSIVIDGTEGMLETGCSTNMSTDIASPLPALFLEPKKAPGHNSHDFQQTEQTLTSKISKSHFSYLFSSDPTFIDATRFVKNTIIDLATNPIARDLQSYLGEAILRQLVWLTPKAESEEEHATVDGNDRIKRIPTQTISNGQKVTVVHPSIMKSRTIIGRAVCMLKETLGLCGTGADVPTVENKNCRGQNREDVFNATNLWNLCRGVSDVRSPGHNSDPGIFATHLGLAVVEKKNHPSDTHAGESEMYGQIWVFAPYDTGCVERDEGVDGSMESGLDEGSGVDWSCDGDMFRIAEMKL